MANLLVALPEQRSTIVDAIEEDAGVFFSASCRPKKANYGSSVELILHEDVTGALPSNLSHGLPMSPCQSSVDGTVTFLSGARAVGMELASYLASALEVDSNKRLYIPHAYAEPQEIDDLQDEFGGRLLEIKGRVYVKFTGLDVEPELVRKSLTSMIGGYSVGWLLDGDAHAGRFCSALMSVFDGEGWAIVGKSAFLSP